VSLTRAPPWGGDCLNAAACVPSRLWLAAPPRPSRLAAPCSGAAVLRGLPTRLGRSLHSIVVDVGPRAWEPSASAHEISLRRATLHTRRTVIATGARAYLPPLPGLAEIVP